MKFVAPCLFGIEGLLSNEMKLLGMKNVMAENGRVVFEGDLPELARANICSRFAERILILVGSFEASSFEQLFDNVTSLPWENYVSKRDAFPVKGWSLNSDLHSIPDCQSIIKKAIVNRLKSKYDIQWFEETGIKMQVQFSILKNQVNVMIDTSGEGLHKRGYRADAVEAPIKETLAAALADIARIYPDTKLYDPFCGSGTILIEAAMISNNIAPGIKRNFIAERFGFVDNSIWKAERERARDNEIKSSDFVAFGSDIDGDALSLCRSNAKKAGVLDYINVKQCDIKDFAFETERALVVTNPPYGERLLDINEARRLYKILGEKFDVAKGRKYYVITSDREFENIFGRKADKRRKLYNGSIECQLYMYFRNYNKTSVINE